MNNIHLIKKLRLITSISIKECQKSLKMNNNNLKKIENNLEFKHIKSFEGIINIEISKNNKKSSIIDLRCETDFVSKNIKFKNISTVICRDCIKIKSSKIKLILNNRYNKLNSIKMKILQISRIFKEKIIIKKLK